MHMMLLGDSQVYVFQVEHEQSGGAGAVYTARVVGHE